MLRRPGRRELAATRRSINAPDAASRRLSIGFGSAARASVITRHRRCGRRARPYVVEVRFRPASAELTRTTRVCNALNATMRLLRPV